MKSRIQMGIYLGLGKSKDEGSKKIKERGKGREEERGDGTDTYYKILTQNFTSEKVWAWTVFHRARYWVWFRGTGVNSSTATYCVSLGNSSSLTLYYYFLFSLVQMKCAKHMSPRAGHRLGITWWICRLRIRWTMLKWYRRQMNDLLLGKGEWVFTWN